METKSIIEKLIPGQGYCLACSENQPLFQFEKVVEELIPGEVTVTLTARCPKCGYDLLEVD